MIRTFLSMLLLPLLLLPVLCAATFKVEGPEKQKAWLEERLPSLTREVEGRLSCESRRNILVQLAGTEREFIELAGPRPAWVAAVAMPGSSTLVVRLSAVHPERGSGLSPVLRHELVHLILPERLSGAEVPQWFEEGLAQVVGGRLVRTDLDRVYAAAATGKLIPFDEITDRFPEDEDRAALAYAQGESLVAFLISEYGLTRLLDAIEAQGSFERAIHHGLSGDLERIIARWKESLAEERPLWLLILGGAFLPLLFFVAAVLAVAAIVRSRLRGRRVYESLPD